MCSTEMADTGQRSGHGNWMPQDVSAARETNSGSSQRSQRHAATPRVSERHPLFSRNVRPAGSERSASSPRLRMALKAIKPLAPRTGDRRVAMPSARWRWLSPTTLCPSENGNPAGADPFGEPCGVASYGHVRTIVVQEVARANDDPEQPLPRSGGSTDTQRWRGRPAAHPDSFSGAIRHALLVGYCFSMLYPDAGPSRSGPRWTALRLLRALYAGVVVAGLSVQAALSLYREMTSESLWDSSVDMMFFGSATAAALLFLELGPRWRRLSLSFECVESRMSDFGYPRHLRRRMQQLTAVIMLGAAVEHILSVWSAVDFTWPCYVQAGPGGLLRGYTKLKFPMTFTVMAYAHWKAVVVLLLNFVGTFFWNFNHLFVMLISMPLSHRFRQVNARLEAVTGKVMSDSFWRRARETYDELSVLTRQVDTAIGKLVLLSFASNMYFICRQLLHSFRTLRTGFWYNVYFSYSFGYMMVRTVLVSLFAASVHDQSRRPLTVLFSVPAEGYSLEVERFMSQVTRDHISLTGCRFFSVTRGLILTVAGTIISYEIVLMQLHPIAASTTHNTTTWSASCDSWNHGLR